MNPNCLSSITTLSRFVDWVTLIHEMKMFLPGHEEYFPSRTLTNFTNVTLCVCVAFQGALSVTRSCPCKDRSFPPAVWQPRRPAWRSPLCPALTKEKTHFVTVKYMHSCKEKYELWAKPRWCVGQGVTWHYRCTLVSQRPRQNFFQPQVAIFQRTHTKHNSGFGWDQNRA